VALRQTAMLEVNEFLVLDFVRERQETTRPEIAHALGLSASSVSRLVARLIREGMVRETGAASSTGGRPRGCIAFIGSGLRGRGGPRRDRCHGALADLTGEILVEDERPNRAAGEAFARSSRSSGTCGMPPLSGEMPWPRSRSACPPSSIQ